MAHGVLAAAAAAAADNEDVVVDDDDDDDDDNDAGDDNNNDRQSGIEEPGVGALRYANVNCRSTTHHKIREIYIGRMINNVVSRKLFVTAFIARRQPCNTNVHCTSSNKIFGCYRQQIVLFMAYTVCGKKRPLYKKFNIFKTTQYIV